MLVLTGPRYRVDDLVFSPDGGSLLSPRPHKGALRWNLDGRGEEPELLHGDWDVRSVQFSPDGKWLVFAGEWVIVRNLATGKETEATFPAPFANWVTVSLTPGGGRFVAALGDYSATPARLVCRALSAPDADVWAVDVESHLHSSALFFPGGKQFVAIEWWNGDKGREHGPAFVTRNARTAKVVSEVRERGNGFSGLAQSTDLRYVALKYEAGITVYPTADFRTPVATIKNATRKHFTGVAYHPSGRYLAATSNDKTVKLYDTATWQLAKTFTWDIGRMRSIAFNPDGTLAAAGSDSGKVVVWDVDL